MHIMVILIQPNDTDYLYIMTPVGGGGGIYGGANEHFVLKSHVKSKKNVQT